MRMGSQLLDAASVNSAVISRGAADCATARGGGTRTSLFGSIAQRFEALQYAAGSSHATMGRSREFCWRGSSLRMGRGEFGGESVGGKRASGWTGSWGALTCSRYRPDTRRYNLRQAVTVKFLLQILEILMHTGKEKAIGRSACLSRQILYCYTCTKKFNCLPGSILIITCVRSRPRVYRSARNMARSCSLFQAQKALGVYFSAFWARASLLAWASERTSPCLPFCLS